LPKSAVFLDIVKDLFLIIKSKKNVQFLRGADLMPLFAVSSDPKQKRIAKNLAFLS